MYVCTGFRLGVGECHEHLRLPALAGEWEMLQSLALSGFSKAVG